MASRSRTFVLYLLATLLAQVGYAAGAADPAKILRLATNDVDTFDPQQWQDRYSQEIGMSIFESLYEWDYLARPPGIVPNTAAAAPEVSIDGEDVDGPPQAGHSLHR